MELLLAEAPRSDLVFSWQDTGAFRLILVVLLPNLGKSEQIRDQDAGILRRNRLCVRVWIPESESVLPDADRYAADDSRSFAGA